MTSIKNENDYQKALETLELVFNAKKASPEGVHLEMLSRLVG